MGDIPRNTDPFPTTAPPAPKTTTTTTEKTTTTTTDEKPTTTTTASAITTTHAPAPIVTSSVIKSPTSDSHSVSASFSSPALVSPSVTPSPLTALPVSKGDDALFGRPATVGGFNMTAGILIYGSFVVLFVAAVGFATVHRLRTRRAFRLKQMATQEGPGRGNDDGESGRRGLPRGLVGGIGGTGEKRMYMDEDLKLEFGDDEKENMGAVRGMEDEEEDMYTYPNRSELFKKASMSRKALMSDAAPATTSPPLKAVSTTNANTPSARAAKRASSSSTSSSRSKRLSSAQEYDIYTSGSRGGVMTAAAAVTALDRPKAAISNPVVRFEDTDSTMGSILISRPSFSKTTSIASSDDLDHMTSYSPEPVLLEIDDESDYSSPPLRESPSALDTTYKVLTTPPPAAYHSRGQQGYMAPTQSSTTQQKRQSPPPPPKSLKRLSPVSTAGATLAKNYQQAHPIASTAKLGPTKTSTTPAVSTAALSRSNTLRTGFTSTSARGANNNGLKRSSSTSTTSSISSLASSKTGRSGNIYYNASHYGRSEFSPAENRKEIDTDKYPVPVLRSTSTRLPMEMRKGGAPAIAAAAATTTTGYSSNDASNYF
ncbi:hypothetical protein EC957_004680 [Mortierella hygrophila]|uniref:Uncharacterized protein n=1 Tax=Mortierella hygrophila TaxID=979708 RepID=A0A9P6F268_9FUNG|nr:hypothetical protein EC957_004680 [Mortierella hygrophila]